MKPVHPHLHQISVSPGGVPKTSVPAARVSIHGLEGDRQRNRKVHGGPDRAVCLYSLEVIEALRAEGHLIVPGAAGENLTLAGLDWSKLVPGDRLTIGETLHLQITGYTEPCRHNAQWFKDRDVDRIAQDRHPGWSRLYARVLQEGFVQPGDPVSLEPHESTLSRLTNDRRR